MSSFLFYFSSPITILKIQANQRDGQLRQSQAEARQLSENAYRRQGEQIYEIKYSEMLVRAKSFLTE